MTPPTVITYYAKMYMRLFHDALKSLRGIIWCGFVTFVFTDSVQYSFNKI